LKISRIEKINNLEIFGEKGEINRFLNRHGKRPYIKRKKASTQRKINRKPSGQ
jgi:hypothetical protein